jgi:hypothetical protein
VRGAGDRTIVRFLRKMTVISYVTKQKVFMKYSFGIVIFSLSLAISLSLFDDAQASEGTQSTCNISCPTGQKVVSFTDGDNVACVCAPETEMVPTEPDPSVVDSGEYEDAGQKE